MQDILFTFYKAMTKMVQVSGSGIVMQDWGEFMGKEGVMELSLLCLYPFFSLSFFSPLWNSFVKGALELLHVDRFVVDDVFFIFRDIYKSVYRKHTTTTAERKHHLYHTSRSSCNKASPHFQL